jgi:FmdE protein associated with molybdenum formylmethanofuran dehydrogenase
MTRIAIVLCLAVVLGGAATARAETPDEWIKLLTRVHGGFGSFLPVGIRIGEDAMQRLGAKPRELSVVFYRGEGTPCPCAADGVSLAVYASAGQGTLQIAPEKSPPGTFAALVIRPAEGRRRPPLHRADGDNAETRRDQHDDQRSARALRCGDGNTRPLYG